MEKIVSLCKRRGYVFPSSEIYGGLDLLLGLRSARRRTEAQSEDLLVGGHDQPPRRYRRARCRHSDASAGLAHVGPRRRVHRPDGRLQEVQGAVPGRQAGRGTLSDEAVEVSARMRRRIDRGAQVQPDVQDSHGTGRGFLIGDLSAAGDGAGDLCQFSEREEFIAAEDPVRDRADRQGVPQRDHAGQFHFPDARIRADGDAVLHRSPAKTTSGWNTGGSSAGTWYEGLGIKMEKLRWHQHGAERTGPLRQGGVRYRI